MTLARLPHLATALTALLPAAALAGDGPIQDNSFLLEEAYNQEPGVIQHISAFSRATGASGAWVYTFTEEWPVRGLTHQASVTLPVADVLRRGGTAGVGDVLLNYRWQAVGSGKAPVAFAPRLSAVLPTGAAEDGLGGDAGVEVNLPLSVVLSGRFVSHVNVGARWTPEPEVTTWTAGQSFIWLAHAKLNVLVEGVYSQTSAGAGSTRTESLTVNPGLRGAIDVGDLQIVPGLSFPLGVGPSRGDRAVFLYLSLEHPFRWAGPTEE